MAPSMWAAPFQALVLAVGQQIHILGIAGILTVVVDVIPKALSGVCALRLTETLA